MRPPSRSALYTIVLLSTFPASLFAQTTGTVTEAQGNLPNTPIIATITTSPDSKNLLARNRFTFTVKGSNFDKDTAFVQFNGPDCSPCLVPNQLLTKKTDTELAGAATVPTKGDYTVSVQNGKDPHSSNALPLSFGDATTSPGVNGSGAAAISFNIDKEFCSHRDGYQYTSTDPAKPSEVVSLPGNILVGVTDHIPDLNSIVDAGQEILSSTSQTKLQPDGSDASRLLIRSFAAGTCEQGKAPQNKSNFRLLGTVYYILNIVRWEKSKAAAGDQQPYQVSSNDWYLFNTQDNSLIHQKPFHGKFSPQLTGNTRIYGSDSVGFLAVHLRGEIPQADFEKLQINYNVTVKQTTPINVQHLETLIGVITGIDLGGGAKPALVAAGQPPPPTAVGLYGGGALSNVQNLPNDITFAATVKFPPNAAAGAAASGQPAPTTFSNTYHDEGLQHWDVSVAVPVNSIKELNYSSTDGAVTGKEASRYNAYGLFDVYPWAVDINDPPAFAYPHAVFGLPFSGKVFNKPFLGLGGALGFQSLPWIGKFLNTAIPVRLNFYGGVVYNKEFRPSTLKVGQPASPGAVANDLHGVRVWKGQFGIEFSIKDVASKLKGNSKSDSKNNSKNDSSAGAKGK